MAEAVHARVRAMLPEPGSDDARRAAQRVEWCSTFFAEAPPVVAVTRQPYTTVIEGALADSLTSGADINATRGCPDLQPVGTAVEHPPLAAWVTDRAGSAARWWLARRSSRCRALMRPTNWRRWWRSVCRRQWLQLVTTANQWTRCSGSSGERSQALDVARAESIGGSAWESNPAPPREQGATDFEDREGHRAPFASVDGRAARRRRWRLPRLGPAPSGRTHPPLMRPPGVHRPVLLESGERGDGAGAGLRTRSAGRSDRTARRGGFPRRDAAKNANPR